METLTTLDILNTINNDGKNAAAKIIFDRCKSTEHPPSFRTYTHRIKKIIDYRKRILKSKNKNVELHIFLQQNVTLPKGNPQLCQDENNAGSVCPCSAGYVSLSLAKENTEQRMKLNEYSQEMKKD